MTNSTRYTTGSVRTLTILPPRENEQPQSSTTDTSFALPRLNYSTAGSCFGNI